MTSEVNLEYADGLADGLELIWGDGIHFPGGSEEVGQLLQDFALDGRADRHW